jgi:hypothetical protein
MKKRIKEPSTWAGFALVAQGIAQLLASKGVDPTAWATVIGGVIAVAAKEKGTAQ